MKADGVRLRVCDLDGTLLRSDGTVSDRTRAAMRTVGAQGVATVLVTARPPRWLHGLADVVGSHGTALCANGAFVYHVARRQVAASRTIDRALLGGARVLVGPVRVAVRGDHHDLVGDADGGPTDLVRGHDPAPVHRATPDRRAPRRGTLRSSFPASRSRSLKVLGQSTAGPAPERRRSATAGTSARHGAAGPAAGRQ